MSSQHDKNKIVYLDMCKARSPQIRKINILEILGNCFPQFWCLVMIRLILFVVYLCNLIIQVMHEMHSIFYVGKAFAYNFQVLLTTTSNAFFFTFPEVTIICKIICIFLMSEIVLYYLCVYLSCLHLEIDF